MTEGSGQRSLCEGVHGRARARACWCGVDLQHSEPGVCAADQSCASSAAAPRTFCSEAWNTHVFNYLYSLTYLFFSFLIELKIWLHALKLKSHFTPPSMLKPLKLEMREEATFSQSRRVFLFQQLGSGVGSCSCSSFQLCPSGQSSSSDVRSDGPFVR